MTVEFLGVGGRLLPKGTAPNLAGDKFGRLTLLSRVKGSWNVVCECGEYRIVTQANLRRGNSTSCGCLGKEKTRKLLTTHGMSLGGDKPHYLYRTWKEMHARCYNPKNKSYPCYGGRGIKVCAEWRDFTKFIEDLGERPVGMSLDRKDVNGDYRADNCKWSTAVEQARNTRRNRLVSYQGRNICLAEAVGLSTYMVSYDTAKQRLAKLGWSEEEALGPGFGPPKL